MVGVYNATGPEKELPMKSFVEGVRKGVGSDVSFTWVANDFLTSKGIHDQFPLYAPPTGETAGFHRANASRALAKGLKFHPVSDTARSTLDWYKTLPSEIQGRAHHNSLKVRMKNRGGQRKKSCLNRGASESAKRRKNKRYLRRWKTSKAAALKPKRAAVEGSGTMV